jgi:hypothetical protein
VCLSQEKVIQRLAKDQTNAEALAFNVTFEYADDDLSINNQ